MARSDGDSWDLASSVGSTATWVAAGRALASKQPDPFIQTRMPTLEDGWCVSLLSTADAYATNGFTPPHDEPGAATAPGHLTATLDS